MILTDYFRSTKDAAWDIARQCGVKHATLRLPEDADFDVTSLSHWRTVYDRLVDFGVTPYNIEPMPNALHDHIKIGDEMRDECIDKVIRMFPIMQNLGIHGICFNFMAHVGWLRTRSDYPERGGARVTAFDIDAMPEHGKCITADRLWDNYSYFIQAVVPEAEKYGIVLSLHPDDPPLARLHGVERIMISRENIRRALFGVCESPALGLTLCQANFVIMGEDLLSVAEEFKEKIQFIHFRNTAGTPEHFRETFHDNGVIPMAKVMRAYHKMGIHVPVRVDHVPTLLGEQQTQAGYDALGRLYAIGYLKGILEAIETEE